MDNFVYDGKSVTNVEIIRTLKNVQANFSLKSCESLLKLFQKMFPDSVIAKNSTFSKDKYSYYISYGIQPYCKLILTNEIKGSPYYSKSFDETLNKVTQQEQMDIYMTFWNSDRKRVESRYFETDFMGYTTANDLLNSFQGQFGTVYCC